MRANHDYLDNELIVPDRDEGKLHVGFALLSICLVVVVVAKARTGISRSVECASDDALSPALLKPSQVQTNGTAWTCYPGPMTKISVNDNGPLRLEGTFTITDASGKEFGLAGRTVVSLCRCGQSANKPFCDGQHARQGWQSTCEARDLPPPKPKM